MMTMDSDHLEYVLLCRLVTPMGLIVPTELGFPFFDHCYRTISAHWMDKNVLGNVLLMTRPTDGRETPTSFPVFRRKRFIIPTRLPSHTRFERGRWHGYRCECACVFRILENCMPFNLSALGNNIFWSDLLIFKLVINGTACFPGCHLMYFSGLIISDQLYYWGKKSKHLFYGLQWMFSCEQGHLMSIKCNSNSFFFFNWRVHLKTLLLLIYNI